MMPDNDLRPGEFTDESGKRCRVLALVGTRGNRDYSWAPTDTDYSAALRAATRTSAEKAPAAPEPDLVNASGGAGMLEKYKDVLTVDEVAEALRMSRRSVYAYIEAGAIRSFRLKNAAGNPMRKVFIPKQSLLDYLVGQDNQSQ